MVCIFTSLVHANTSSLADSNDNDSLLLVLLQGIRRGWGGRIGGIFGDANMGDVRLGNCTVGGISSWSERRAGGRN